MSFGCKCSSSIGSNNQTSVCCCTCMVDDLTSAVGQLGRNSLGNEKTILSILHDRYLSDLIYTRIGSVLIAINPYRNLPGLYGHKAMCAVHQSNQQKKGFFSAAHIYSIAEEAFQSLLEGENPQDQTLIITGESGSGKTESTKLIVEYLTRRCSSPGDQSSLCRLKPISNHQQQQIIDSNPILEAFGNARTCKNDNSSRFGKYIDLEIENRAGLVMSGARITHYLLERSRITAKQRPSERNYHIFYFLQAGATATLRKQLSLDDQSFEYARIGGNCLRSEDIDGWHRLHESFKVLNFTSDLVQSIFRVVAIILHLGQITFRKMFVRNSDSKSVVENLKPVQIVSELMEIERENALVDAFTHKTLSLQRSSSLNNMDTVQRCLQADQARNVRDSFARCLYNRLFVWIVQRINLAIKNQDQLDLSTTAAGSSSHHRRHHIGILDIFGFEQIENATISATQFCGFEQFCINYANERLHQFFVDLTLEQEQKLYEQEGISWDRVDYTTNKAVLDVLADGRMNIIALIKEETIFPQGNDASLLLKIKNIHGGDDDSPNSEVISVLNKHVSEGRDMFCVRHYAGEIAYNIEGFVEKNKDELNLDLLSLVDTHCQNGFVRSLFELNRDEIDTVNSLNMALTVNEKRRRSRTLISRFQHSLENLMNVMKHSKARFVRCIRPNTQKAPQSFDCDLVLKQIRYSALMETIRLKQTGYPVRLEFSEFIRRFRALVSAPISSRANYRSLSAGLMMVFCRTNGISIPQQIQLGKSLVFVKSDTYRDLVDWYEISFRGRMSVFVSFAQTRNRIDQISKVLLAIACFGRLCVQTIRCFEDCRFTAVIGRLAALFQSSAETKRLVLARDLLELNSVQNLFYDQASTFSTLPVPHFSVLSSRSGPKAKSPESEQIRAIVRNSVKFDCGRRCNQHEIIDCQRKLLAFAFRANAEDAIFGELLKRIPNYDLLLISLSSMLSVCGPSDSCVRSRLMDLLLSMQNKPTKYRNWLDIAIYRMNRASKFARVKRSTIPTEWETKETWAKENCVVPVWTMSNSRFDLKLDSWSTCEEMLDFVSNEIGLRDRFGFSLFIAFNAFPSTETKDNPETQMPRLVCLNVGFESNRHKTFFFDIISKYSSYASWRIYLRKEVFSPWHDSTADSVATQLIFDQIYEGLRISQRQPRIQTEYRCRTSDQLADIVAKIILAKFPGHRDYEQKLKMIFVPEPSLNFLRSFNQFISSHRSSTTAILCAQVVDFAFRHWPTYFSRVFWCRNLGSQKRIAALVNWTGLLLMNEHFDTAMAIKTKNENSRVETTRFASFAEMLTIGISSENVHNEHSNRFVVSINMLHCSDEIKLLCTEVTANALHDIMLRFLEGLKKRSKFMVALKNHGTVVRKGELVTLVQKQTSSNNQRILVVRAETNPTKTAIIPSPPEFPLHRDENKPSERLLRKIRSALFDDGQPEWSSSTRRIGGRFPAKNSLSPESYFALFERYATANFVDGQTAVFQSTPLRNALLKRIPTKNVPLALAMFNEINRYAESGRHMSVDQVIGPCLRIVESYDLVDECYCQLLKQLNPATTTTANKTENRYWQLLWLLTGCCVHPSDNDLTVLIHRILEKIAKKEDHPMAADCLNRFERTQNKPSRRMPPCFVEIDAIQNEILQIYHRIRYPDGQEAAIPVDSDSTSEEISMRAILTRGKLQLDLKKLYGSFHLIVELNETSSSENEATSCLIGQNEYFFDFVRSLLLLLNRKDSRSNTAGSTAANYTIYVQRRLWISVEPGQDKLLDEVCHFPQELNNFLRGRHGHLDELTETELAKLASRSIQSLSSDQIIDLRRSAKPVVQHQNEGRHDLKLRFLRKLKEASAITFGASFFDVRCAQIETVDQLAVNSLGIVLYRRRRQRGGGGNSSNRSLLDRVIPLDQVYSWTATDDDDSISSILITFKSSSSVNSLLFYTKDAYRIDEILTAYANSLSTNVERS